MSLSCSLLHTGGSIRFKGNQKCALVCRLPQRQHISACLELSKGLCTGSQLQSGPVFKAVYSPDPDCCAQVEAFRFRDDQSALTFWRWLSSVQGLVHWLSAAAILTRTLQGSVFF